METRNRVLVASVAVLTAAGILTTATTAAPAREATVASSQVQELGSIDFPTSGSAQAQRYFIRGVLLLHSFEDEDAATAFREAQRLDPNFAMAYWGEARTYNHPIWNQKDEEATAEALGRLGPTVAARLAKAPTEKEKDWLRTLDVLYAEGDKYELDAAYADAMRRMHEKYPDDQEVAAFYALSILGTRHGDRDQATYMRAAAVALPIFDKNPQHPGAAHYIIHSFDDPVHAPLGLPAARAYSKIAPGAAHAQHMCSHIFVAMGMWDDVVDANEAARDVENARLVELGRPANLCGHYSSWLQYGYLQQGRFEMAEELMNRCHERAVADGRGNAGSFTRMRARYILDTERWDETGRWPLEVSGNPRVATSFTDGFAAIKRGDAGVARRALAEIEADAERTDSVPAKILALELGAMLAVEAGRVDEALAQLRRATEMEEAMAFEFGPPAIIKPSHELLGEVLLELGRGEEAADAFRGALARTPLRTASLVGLLEAARASGDAATAAETVGQLHDIWRRARGDFVITIDAPSQGRTRVECVEGCAALVGSRDVGLHREGKVHLPTASYSVYCSGRGVERCRAEFHGFLKDDVAGSAPAQRGDFVINVEAPGGQTTLECVVGCAALVGAGDISNYRGEGRGATYSFSCAGSGCEATFHGFLNR